MRLQKIIQQSPRLARPGLGRAHRRGPGRRHPTDGATWPPTSCPRSRLNAQEITPCLHDSVTPRSGPTHLDRHALIYVRQSTPMQVRDNIASTARQYDLARSAEPIRMAQGTYPSHRPGPGSLRRLRDRSRRLPVPDGRGRPRPRRRRPQPRGLPPGTFLQRLVSPHRDLWPDRYPRH